MYKLPANFTGYHSGRIDFDEFKVLCYSLQGLGVINVKGVNGYEYPKNYYMATVTDSLGEFNIYMNCYCPVIAFGELTYEKEVYLDKKELAKNINDVNPEITVLDTSQLTEQITSGSKKDLGAIEVKELKFWLPCTVGRALFSWFFD